MFGIDDQAAASLISGGIGAIGSVISGNKQANLQKEINAQNIAMQRETNQMQREMFTQNLLYGTKERREQNAENWRQAVDMFNMENAYNTPAMQVARYLQAGINPMAAAKDAGLASGQGASSGMMSQSGIPGLTAPHAQPYSIGSQLALDNVQSLAGVVGTLATAKRDVSSSRLNDAQKNATLSLLDSQIADNWAKVKSQEAETAYKTTQNNLDLLYGDEYRKGINGKLVQELKNMAAQYTVYMQQADYVEAQKLFQEAQTRLTDSKNDLVKQQTPIVLENMKKTGRLILEQAKAAAASANQSNAVANLTTEQAQTIRENRPNVLELTRNQVREAGARAKVAESTTMQQIESWKNRVKLEGKQAEQLDQAIRKAKKDNDWYEVDKVIDILSTISDEALGWASFGVSKLGSQRTGTRTHVERYDANGDMTGYTDSVNEYLYK